MKRKILRHIKSFFISIRYRSIQVIITVSFMAVTMLAMVFVGVTLYRKVSTIAEESAAINTRQIIGQVNTNLDYYLRSMLDISYSLKNLIYETENIPDQKLSEQMDVILKSRNDIVSLAVFSEDGKLVSNAPSYKVKDIVNINEQDWFKAAIKDYSTIFFSSPHVQNIFSGQHSWVVSLSRQVTLNRNGRKEKGVLLVDLNFSVIDQLCQQVKLGKKGYIYIIDSKGNIVYHPQQQLINVGLKHENIDDVMEHIVGRYFDVYEGQKRLIIIETVNYCRWRIVGIAYMDEIVSLKEDMGSYVLTIFILGFIVVFVISAIISAKISQPIKQLERSMKMVENGQLDVNIDVKGEAEVARLSRTFNLMVSKIRELMAQIVLEQEAKRRSEINALQAQINPHFLYNTLDSVVWMAENGKSQDVITMITALARFFRISISRGKNIITVREELEHARNYLIIQSIRYKNKFTYEIKADQEVMECKSVKLILQPIVENSIYHGIEYMMDQGFIKITASIRDGKLLYEVMDNGLGMSEETLKNLFTDECKSGKGSGVGIKNVQERIQLYYGKDYGIEIESEIDVGTTVRIWLPVCR